MAQVVDQYSAVTTNRGYIYYKADGSTGGVQYEAGTSLRLPKDYASRITNSRYPVTSPMSGWMNWTYIGSITPIYTTTTDACTPPTALSISGRTLTITGGAGGDLNALEGFGISWRERDMSSTTWGSWSTETVSASRTVAVTVNAGKVRQYRVRTRGSAGSSYYSAWVVCETLLSGNTAAKTPTITLPGNEAVTVSRTPVVVVNCGADNEGDQMTLKRSIDSAAWTSAATVGGSGGTVYDRLPALADGRHTIRYKLTDANGADSGEASVSMVLSAAAWSRSIASGDIISNREISHAADISEMLYAVNIQRLYYGLDAITLPGMVGLFKDWGRQMEALMAATNACLAAAGQAVTASEVSDTWPNAATINAIREKILLV